jgi:hypothetical protein
MLNLDSSIAAIMPVGPAPAIKTGFKSSLMFVLQHCDLGLVNRFIALPTSRCCKLELRVISQTCNLESKRSLDKYLTCYKDLGDKPSGWRGYAV